MKNLYVGRSILVALILMVSNLVYGESRILILGDDDFPPFSFRDSNNNVTGIDVDVVNELARRLDLKITIKLMPWKRLLRMTKDGTCDASFSLFRTKERESYAIFTSFVHISTYRIFTSNDRIPKFDSLEDLYGKRIGKPAGFVISEEYDKAVENGKIKSVDNYTFENLISRLEKGYIDGFIGNSLTVKYKMKNAHEEAAFYKKNKAIGSPVKESRKAFFVVSRKSELANNQKLISKITKTLKDITADGTSEKITRKYIQ